MKMRNFKTLLYFMFASLCMWISITCCIQRFKCTRMTETELFLYIPQSFICDWKHCD